MRRYRFITTSAYIVEWKEWKERLTTVESLVLFPERRTKTSNVECNDWFTDQQIMTSLHIILMPLILGMDGGWVLMVLANYCTPFELLSFLADRLDLQITFVICYHSFGNDLLRQSDFKHGLFQFSTNKFHSHSLIIIVTQIFKDLCPIGDLVNAAIFCFLCKFNAKMIFPSDYFCNNC